MTKINASTGIAIFFGVVALLLYWMKADRNVILLEVFFLIYGAILFAQVVRKKSGQIVGVSSSHAGCADRAASDAKLVDK